MNTVEEHHDKLIDIEKWYKRIDATIYRQLKNNDIENELLGREINRMHEIERIKVQHANNILYNPDNGNILPSFNTMYASYMNSPSIA